MKFLVAALLVGSSVAAFAQSGSLSGVQGNVIVTSGAVSMKAGSDVVLKNGDVITASSGASAVVKVGKCNVFLTPGQSLVVNSALPCAELSASVKTMIVPNTVVAADADSSMFANFPGGIVGAGIAIVGGGLIIREVTKSEKASGS